MNMQLYLPALAEPSEVDVETRTLSVVITARRQDRDGDIVEPAGLDFTEYLKNPVVLWAHALDRPPVGRVLAVRVEDERVVATVQFADTATGRELFDLYRGRYLSGWSIGFLPREVTPLDRGERGLRIATAEIVELSAVPVPSNPDALTRGLGQSLRRTAVGADASHPAVTETPSAAEQLSTRQGLPSASGISGTRAPASRKTFAAPSPRSGVPACAAVDLAFRRACRRMREEIALAVRHARGELDPA